MKLKPEISGADVANIFGGIFLVALLVERAVEMFVSAWCGEKQEKLAIEAENSVAPHKAAQELTFKLNDAAQRIVLQTAKLLAAKTNGDTVAESEAEAKLNDLYSDKDKLEKALSAAAVTVDPGNTLTNEQAAVREYKVLTSKVALSIGLVFGLLASTAGFRIMEFIVDPTSLAGVNCHQQTLFRSVDILLTGALLGGGAEPIHKVITAFTTFMDVTRKKAEAQAPKYSTCIPPCPPALSSQRGGRSIFRGFAFAFRMRRFSVLPCDKPGRISRENRSMQVTKFIGKNGVVSQLLAANKAEALKELTHVLFERKKMDNSATALDQIMARETTESTGIGHGIAVPHARISGLKSLVCAVGRVRGGLDYLSVDRKPVHLIFLICYPPTQQTTYLNFLATIAKAFRDMKNMEAALLAADDEELFAVLERITEPLAEPEGAYAKQLKTDPGVLKTRDAHADLILLARLQLCIEMHDAAKTGKKQLKEKIDAIRGLVDPRVLRQFDKLMLRRAPAVVPVEGDTCQGCFMKLPSQFAQRVRQEPHLLHVCNNCSRFIYII